MATIKKIGERPHVRYKAIVRKRGLDLLDGKTARKSVTKTFNTKSAAERWARETETELELKYAGHIHEGHNKTINEAIERYLVEILPTLSPTSQKTYRQQLAFWATKFKGRKLADISAPMVSRVRDELAAEDVRKKPEDPPRHRAPQTVQHYLISLASLYKAVIKSWHWLPDNANPMHSVAKMKFNNERTRMLSREEIRALLRECHASESEFLYPLVLLALTTGARQGEITKLRWDQIDWKRKQIRLHDTKNKDSRSLPIDDSVLPLLKEIRDRDGYSRTSGLVFPGTMSPDKPVNVRQSFANAMKRAGIENATWHDMRHAVASHLAESGATLAEIGAVLGHRSANTTRRYAHLTEQHQHQLVRETMGAIVKGAADDE